MYYKLLSTFLLFVWIIFIYNLVEIIKQPHQVIFITGHEVNTNLTGLLTVFYFLNKFSKTILFKSHFHFKICVRFFQNSGENQKKGKSIVLHAFNTLTV